MSMSNKEKLFLAGLQESMKEFVKVDIGKTARADLKALENAAGGAKKLADADNILADAKRQGDDLIAKGRTAVAEMLRTAEAEIKTAQAAINSQKQRLENSWGEYDKARDILAAKDRKHEVGATVLMEGEADHDRSVAAVVVRENKALDREKEVGVRETQVEDRQRRFKDAAA